MMRCLLIIALLLPGLSGATVYDLGSLGRTYAIAEPDMLAGFYNKLNAAEADGKMAALEAQMKERFIAHANRPKGVALPRAQQHRVRYVDPSVVLSDDIRDHQGKVLWPAGTHVNPLDYVAMRQQWLFFDGDDPEQAEWARAYLNRFPEQVRPILTQGAVLALSDAWGTRLYFDQHGHYSRKFGIQAVPALVSQEGNSLRIDEIVPGDGHG